VNAQLESPAAEWVKVTLRGVGQVMFQDHALSGLLFLLGIAAASPLMAAGGLAGAAIGTATAWLLRFDPREIRDGIYGFNATLVGVATFFFLKPVALAVVLMVVGSAASTVITWASRRYLPFPTYTAPFIVTTWAIVWVADRLGLPRAVSPPPPTTFDIFTSFTEGFSEVFLQANQVTGLFFLAALAVSNWRHAVLGVLGSFLGMLVAFYHRDLAGEISIGIYGYNGTLAAIGLYLWRPSLLIPILGILISTPITEFFPLTGLPTLTAPFVLACWIVIAIGYLEKYFVEPQAKF
jgi:urea transporter